MMVVDYKDLHKHFPIIIGSGNLSNLTATQIETVAFMMETSYQKGRESKDEVQKPDFNVVNNITVNSDNDDIKQAVEKAMNQLFRSMREITDCKVSY